MSEVKIHVVTLEGKQLTLHPHPEATVLELKQLIHREKARLQCPAPETDTRLSFANTVLQDHQRLDKKGVVECCTLHEEPPVPWEQKLMLAITRDDAALAVEALGAKNADPAEIVRKVFTSPNYKYKDGFTAYYYGCERETRGESSRTELYRTNGLEKRVMVQQFLGVFSQFELQYDGVPPGKIEYCEGDTALHICVRNKKLRVAHVLRENCASSIIKNILGETAEDLELASVEETEAEFRSDPRTLPAPPVDGAACCCIAM